VSSGFCYCIVARRECGAADTPLKKLVIGRRAEPLPGDSRCERAPLYTKFIATLTPPEERGRRPSRCSTAAAASRPCLGGVARSPARQQATRSGRPARCASTERGRHSHRPRSPRCRQLLLQLLDGVFLQTGQLSARTPDRRSSSHRRSSLRPTAGAPRTLASSDVWLSPPLEGARIVAEWFAFSSYAGSVVRYARKRHGVVPA
jgi:hypothetical protein